MSYKRTQASEPALAMRFSSIQQTLFTPPACAFLMLMFFDGFETDQT
jgi:hypothetical protein